MIPKSSVIFERVLQLSFIIFGAFAVEAYLIIYRATYLGVTTSDKLSKSSETELRTLTSPSLSVKKGIIVNTDLFVKRSQFVAITVNNAIDSFIKLILLSFQSFIFIFTNLTTASMTSGGGFIVEIFCYIPLKPSTFSFHFFVSSKQATTSDGNVSATFASASSLLNPEPTSSSYICGPLGPPAVDAVFAAVLAGAFFSSSIFFGGTFFITAAGSLGALSSFISSSIGFVLFANLAGGPFFGADEGGGPPKASSPRASRLYVPRGNGLSSSSTTLFSG